MTPKEKANELYGKFRNENSIMTANVRAKKQALLCVNELIIQNGELYLSFLGDKTIEYFKAKNVYLFEVKSEIEKL